MIVTKIKIIVKLYDLCTEKLVLVKVEKVVFYTDFTRYKYKGCT